MAQTTFELKDYQRECLAVLSKFLRDARASLKEGGAEAAFNRLQDKRKPSGTYSTVPGWRESAAFPYVCLRVPTGGGKTLMAGHAVGIVAKQYLHADRCVVLWLAPSEKIVAQTMRQLRERGNPVRKAVADAMGGQIEVLSIREALSVSRATLDGATTIIVSTVQAWRVDAKEGRKVYQPDNGALMHHFDGAPPTVLKALEKSADGTLFYSLANVLRIRKPIVIADEAHHFRTKLTFQTLKRFSPAAILEFTATPPDAVGDKIPANVLAEATASDLKSQEMIKAPIILKETAHWQDAVRLAAAKRRELERIATAEQAAGAEYIRPVLLLQAEPGKDDPHKVNVETLRKFLMQEERAAEEEIAVYTSDEKSLPDNMLSDACPVKYVITVEALREGWDCPFAYVLCTVSPVTASGPVEQLLGRILRMPYVKNRAAAALNNAYCYTPSEKFSDAANALHEALVAGGFGKDESENMVQRDASSGEAGGAQLRMPLLEPTIVHVAAKPDTVAIKALPASLREHLSVKPADDGAGAIITWTGGPIEPATAKKLAAAINTDVDATAGERLRRASFGEDDSPSAMGLKLVVPGLVIPDAQADGGLTLFDSQNTEIPWTLRDCDARLDAEHFDPAPPLVTTTTMDVDDQGRWRDRLENELREAVLWQDAAGPKSKAELAAWLDREVFDTRVTQPDKSQFIDNALAYLLGKRGLSLDTLVPARWQLAASLAYRIDKHRLQQERAEFQRLLSEVVTVPNGPEPGAAFDFTRAIGVYPALKPYRGKKTFAKHYYKHPAEMNDEEAVCAALIDAHPNVETWVRNLESDRWAFWLPLGPGRFYPDFVARLRDDRYAVIEYKGAHLDASPGQDQKRQRGELYAERSNGLCVFLWATLETMRERIANGLAKKT